MNRHDDQQRPATARRSADAAASLAFVIDAITNSTMQDIAKSLLRQHCMGGLGDSRVLRAAVREIVACKVQKMADSRKSKEANR